MLPLLETGKPFVDLFQCPLLTGLTFLFHAQFEVLQHRKPGEDGPVFRHIANSGMGNFMGLLATERLAIELHVADGGYETHYRLAKGGAADAVAPQQADNLARLDRHVDPAEDVALAVVGIQILNLEHQWTSVPR